MEANGAEGVTARRFGRGGGIGTAIIFLAILVLWLWCRDGATSLIRIVASGDEVKAYFNGKLLAEGRDAGVSREGGIWISCGREPYWGFPIPEAVEFVRVTDNATGAILLDQDFRQPISEIWTECPPSCMPSRAGLRCNRDGPVRLGTGFRPWTDYTLDLRIRNCTKIEVAVRYRDPANHVLLLARPFRDLDSGFTFVMGGNPQAHKSFTPYCCGKEAAKGILLIFLYYFPWWGPVIVVSTAVIGRAAPPPFPRMASRPMIEAVFIALLFAGSFAYLSWINLALLDGIPHVQDSVVYNFQAWTLSRGALYAPPPPDPASFRFDFLAIKDGKWFGKFPIGHPLLLMLGHLAGRPWIVPPLVGAGVLVLIYLIARELFSREVAALSALLAFFSPLFQVNASNFMSHSSASFYLALGIFFLIRAGRGGRWWSGFLSGVALGLLFNTRPLNSIPAMSLSFALLFYSACRRRASWGSLLSFCAGLSSMFALYLYTNYVLMGNPLRSPYAMEGAQISFFNEKHPLSVALLHCHSLMGLFVLLISGWPPVFTTGFFLAFLLLAMRDVWSVFLFLLFAVMTFVNTLQVSLAGVGYMYGPRFMYEPFFMFIIMAAVGWDYARRSVQRWIEAAASSPLRAMVFSWLAHAAFLAVLAALVFGAERVWLSRSKQLVSYYHIPGNVFSLKGFNHVSGAMIEKIKLNGIHHAIMFVDDANSDWCWWYYGAVFMLNSPFLDSDIIAVRDLGPLKNMKVIDAFPGRRLFRINVERNEILDY